jgi:hypothetical protein
MQRQLPFFSPLIWLGKSPSLLVEQRKLDGL